MRSHYSDESLLAHLDGELGLLMAVAVRLHLETCWRCRARRGDLERQAQWIARILKPESPPSEEAERAKQAFFKWEARSGIVFESDARPERSVPWPRLGAAFAGVLLVCLIAFPFRSRRADPQPIPSQVLMLARRSEAGIAGAQAVVHQSFQLRLRRLRPEFQEVSRKLEIYADASAGRFAGRVEDATGVLRQAVWRSGEHSGYRYEGGRLEPLRVADLNPRLALTDLSSDRLDLDSAERKFLAWLCGRSWEPVLLADHLAEFVSQEGATLLLTRESSEQGGPALRLSAKRQQNGVTVRLTLSLDARTYRTQAETVSFEKGGETLEIRISAERREVLPGEHVSAAIFRPNLPLSQRETVRRTPTVPREIRFSPPRLPESPDLLEMKALAALHGARACLGEPLSVSREAGGRIRVSGLVERAERRAEILAYLSEVGSAEPLDVQIRTLSEALRDAGGAAPTEVAATGTAAAGIRLKRADSPLNDPLRGYFRRLHPGEDARTVSRRVAQLSNEAVTAAASALSEAWALRRLAERFPETEIDRLPAEAKALLDRMIHDHAVAIKAQLSRERVLLEGPLAALGAPVPPVDAPAGNRDALWLFRSTERMNDLVHQLCADAGLPAYPVTGTAGDLMSVFGGLEADVVGFESSRRRLFADSNPP